MSAGGPLQQQSMSFCHVGDQVKSGLVVLNVRFVAGALEPTLDKTTAGQLSVVAAAVCIVRWSVPRRLIGPNGSYMLHHRLASLLRCSTKSLDVLFFCRRSVRSGC